METSFPLRDGYFGPLQYSNEELARWKRLVVELVERTLEEEQPVFASNYERVDSQGWKLIKTKDQLRIHQPRSGSIEAVTAKSPCVLAVGTIEGTLEDVIYGIHNTTTRDIRVTRAFLSDKSLDSAVLHVFENGSRDDPYRSLALKWRAVATPAGSLVKNRDGCVLEYMGIDYDRNGCRYAFQVSENVDHPICPPFTAEGVVRADVHIRAIYRELDAGRVGVFFYGGYDMSGQIPKFLASWTAASVAFAVGKSVECAEAKRLTALALSDLNVTLRQKNRYMQRRLSSMPMCSICCTSPTYLSSFASRSALAECQICTAAMCSKCSSKKFLLSEHSKLRVSCCKQCIVAARSFNVDPRRPLQLVSFPAWVSRGEIAADGASNRPVAKQSLSPLDQRRIIAGLPATGASAYEDDDPTDEMLPPRDYAGWPSAANARASVNWGQGRESSHSSNAPTRRCSSEPHDESPAELWMRMMELRTAAEQTYRITKEVDKLMAPERERLERRERRVRAP